MDPGFLICKIKVRLDDAQGPFVFWSFVISFPNKIESWVINNSK